MHRDIMPHHSDLEGTPRSGNRMSNTGAGKPTAGMMNGGLFPRSPTPHLVGESLITSYAQSNRLLHWHMNLSDQDLDEVPDYVLARRNTRILNLSLNNIIALPSQIQFLVYLQELRVRENQLTALPDQIFKLCFLQILDVSRNKLQEVPALLGDLKELRVLDLSHNQITTFQLSQNSPLRGLRLLASLDVSHNDFSVLPFAELVPLLALPGSEPLPVARRSHDLSFRGGEIFLPSPQAASHSSSMKSLDLLQPVSAQSSIMSVDWQTEVLAPRALSEWLDKHFLGDLAPTLDEFGIHDLESLLRMSRADIDRMVNESKELHETNVSSAERRSPSRSGESSSPTIMRLNYVQRLVEALKRDSTKRRKRAVPSVNSLNGVVSPLAAVKTDSSGSKTTSGGLKSLRRSSTISAHTAVSNADDAHYSSPNMVAGGRRGSILTPILTKQKSSRRASLTTLTLAGTPSPQQASAGGGGGNKKGDLRHKWLNNSALHDSAGELNTASSGDEASPVPSPLHGAVGMDGRKSVGGMLPPMKRVSRRASMPTLCASADGGNNINGSSENLLLQRVPSDDAISNFNRILDQRVKGNASLTYLACHANPLLDYPPREIAMQGGEAVCDYLSATRALEVHIKSMRLVVLGDSESGKTSTLSSLLSQTDKAPVIAPDARTVGMVFEKWEIPESDLTLETIDLAGQSVYSMTHQFFLVRRSVYLLVWRLVDRRHWGARRKKELTFMTKEWVDTIQIRCPGAHVLCVCTHMDAVQDDVALMNEQLEAVMNGLSLRVDHYRKWGAKPNGRRVPIVQLYCGGMSHAINCLTGEGVSDLRKSLINFAKSTPWYNEATPASYVELKDRISALQEGGGVTWLAWPMYEQLCEACGVRDNHVEIATRFLHDLGILCYFRSVKKARSATREKLQSDVMLNSVFISLPWIVDVVKGLIRHDRDALVDFFSAGPHANIKMARRTTRLVIHGVLHPSLVPFLWPQTDSWPGVDSDLIRAYWEQNVNGKEGSLWEGGVVSEDQHGLMRALGLLEGFDIVIDESDKEVHKDVRKKSFVVPRLLAASRRKRGNVEMFKEDHAFSCTINYASLPPGFFERLIVRLRRVSNHVDFNATAAAVYSKGDKLQLFCHDRKAEGEEIRVLFMSTRLFKLFRTELARIETFFPGLLRDTYTIEIHDFRMAETLSYGQTFNVELGNSEGRLPVEQMQGGGDGLDGAPSFGRNDSGSFGSLGLGNDASAGGSFGRLGSAGGSSVGLGSPTSKMANFDRLQSVVHQAGGGQFENSFSRVKSIISRGDDGAVMFSRSPSSGGGGKRGGGGVSWGSPPKIGRLPSIDVGPIPSFQRTFSSGSDGGGGFARTRSVVTNFAQSLVRKGKQVISTDAELEVFEKRLLSRLKQPPSVVICSSKKEKSSSFAHHLMEELAALDPDIICMVSPPLQAGMEPPIMLLCVDENLEGDEECVKLFKKYAESGKVVIPLILPGYVLKDFSKWWPSSMPQLRNFSLFVQLNGEEWSNKDKIADEIEFWEMKKRADKGERAKQIKMLALQNDPWAREVLPFINGRAVDYFHAMRRATASLLMGDIKKALNEWRGRATSINTNDLVPEREKHTHTVALPCPSCMAQGKLPLGVIDRHQCETLASAWKESCNEARMRAITQMWTILTVSAAGPEVPKPPTIDCSWGHKLDVNRLLRDASIVILESIPCPSCMARGELPPFAFSRSECLTFFEESNNARTGFLDCPRCAKHGRPHIRVLDIISPEVFLSYNWGHKVDGRWSTQEIVRRFRRHIEDASDCLCWLDVEGGMSAGDELVTKMRDGVKNSHVVIIFLSDLYLNSTNCKRELVAALQDSKFIIPVLVPPGEGEAKSAGWSGGPSVPGRPWWHHAVDTCTSSRIPESDESIDWSALDDFEPIDLATVGEAAGLAEVHKRILSRLYRGNYIRHVLNPGAAKSLNEKVSKWRRKSIDNMTERMQELNALNGDCSTRRNSVESDATSPSAGPAPTTQRRSSIITSHITRRGSIHVDVSEDGAQGITASSRRNSVVSNDGPINRRPSMNTGTTHAASDWTLSRRPSMNSGTFSRAGSVASDNFGRVGSIAGQPGEPISPTGRRSSMMTSKISRRGLVHMDISEEPG